MQIKMIDGSRIVYLAQVRRDRGQLYLPSAAAALVNRYRFVKVPSTPEEITSGSKLTFEHGVFGDSAIQEFSLYPDGIVLAARAPTSALEAFLADLLKWARQDLGIVEIEMPTKQTFFESHLVVSLDVKQESLLPKLAQFQGWLTKTVASYGARSFDFGF